VPPMLPSERWALTPPFHPCQTSRAFRRRLTGSPVRCHRASLRRRSILCGTFRDVVVAPGFSSASSTSPPGVTRRVALSRVPLTALRSPLKTSALRPPQTAFSAVCLDERRAVNVPQDGVRTFLPSSVISGLARGRLTTGTSDHPARPPVLLYLDHSPCGDQEVLGTCVKRQVLDLRPPLPLLDHRLPELASIGTEHTPALPKARRAVCLSQERAAQSLKRQVRWRQCER
jgi:hypothetical protein